MVDKTIKDLAFGKIESKFYKMTGKVGDRRTIKPMQNAMSYEVEFENGDKAWFLEDELL